PRPAVTRRRPCQVCNGGTGRSAERAVRQALCLHRSVRMGETQRGERSRAGPGAATGGPELRAGLVENQREEGPIVREERPRRRRGVVTRRDGTASISGARAQRGGSGWPPAGSPSWGRS